MPDDTQARRVADDLARDRRDWHAVRDGGDGIGPGFIRICRDRYRASLYARIEELMDARDGTPEAAELKRLATEAEAWEAADEAADTIATLRAENERLLAAIAAEREAKWQPIESAPKDGTEFDVWVPNDTSGYRVTNLHLRGDGGYLWDRRMSIARIARWPTHWRPLPAPPSIEPQS